MRIEVECESTTERITSSKCCDVTGASEVEAQVKVTSEFCGRNSGQKNCCGSAGIEGPAEVAQWL